MDLRIIRWRETNEDGSVTPDGHDRRKLRINLRLDRVSTETPASRTCGLCLSRVTLIFKGYFRPGFELLTWRKLQRKSFPFAGIYSYGTSE